ncbi:hypothetical protein MMC24_000308 [Lignoscripta atroalba]|nr:hypothetical protein [Lignoscripta atroalba]
MCKRQILYHAGCGHGLAEIVEPCRLPLVLFCPFNVRYAAVPSLPYKCEACMNMERPDAEMQDVAMLDVEMHDADDFDVNVDAEKEREERQREEARETELKALAKEVCQAFRGALGVYQAIASKISHPIGSVP